MILTDNDRILPPDAADSFPSTPFSSNPGHSQGGWCRHQTPVVLAALILGALFAPSIIEGATNPCDAGEKLIIRKLYAQRQMAQSDFAFATALQPMSGGSLFASAAQRQNPNLPRAAACIVAYWALMFDNRKIN